MRLPSQWLARNMRLLRLVLAIVTTVAIVSNGITANANEVATTTTTAKSSSVLDSALGLQVVTRKLSGDDAELEERRGGVGGGGGGHAAGGGHAVSGGGGGHATTISGGDTTTGGGHVYGTHTSIGLMNRNSVNDRKTKKKCNRFTNWFKRLFDKSIKKCPKKGEEEEEYIRRHRA